MKTCKKAMPVGKKAIRKLERSVRNFKVKAKGLVDVNLKRPDLIKDVDVDIHNLIDESGLEQLVRTERNSMKSLNNIL